MADQDINLQIKDAQPISVTVADSKPVNVKVGDTVEVNYVTGTDKNYEQDFNDASQLEITHNMNKRPSITVIDSAGDEVEGDYSYPDFNNVAISFSAPFSGKVILN